MNVQELETLVGHNLPVKLFVLNNGGYLSIRQTQTGFFEGRRIGESPDSGVTFPDMVRLGTAYGIPSFTVEKAGDFCTIERELETPGPALFDVHLDVTQGFEPRLRSRILPDGKILTPDLEDMYPFLDPDELASNLLAEDRK
jgi:acetolactate synthase I/II/III large subunit